MVGDLLTAHGGDGAIIPNTRELLESRGAVVVPAEIAATLVRDHFTRPDAYVDGRATDQTQTQIRQLLDGTGGDVDPLVAEALVEAVSPSLDNLMANAPSSVDPDEVNGTEADWRARIDGLAQSVAPHDAALQRLIVASELVREQRLAQELAGGPGAANLEEFSVVYDRWLRTVEEGAHTAGVSREDWSNQAWLARVGAGAAVTGLGAAFSGPAAPFVLGLGSAVTDRAIGAAQKGLEDVHDADLDAPVTEARNLLPALTYRALLADPAWAARLTYPPDGPIRSEEELTATIEAALRGDGASVNAVEDLRRFTTDQSGPVVDVVPDL